MTDHTAVASNGPTNQAQGVSSSEQHVYRCVVDIWMERGIANPARERTRRVILYPATSLDDAMQKATEGAWVFAPMGPRFVGAECMECSQLSLPYCLPDEKQAVSVVVKKLGNNRPKSKRR